MKYDWVDEYLLKKRGVTKDFQAEWNWVRYYVGGKMFAAVCSDDDNNPYYITLKLDPLEGEILRKKYEDVIPGYYMNKTHWNSIKVNGSLADDTVRDILDHSYDVTFGSLTKKKQKEIPEG